MPYLSLKQISKLDELQSCMNQAFFLKEALSNIPLNIAVNAAGEEYLKPPLFNEHIPHIKQEVVNFAKAMESLPFEIPLFDDDYHCTKEAVLSTIGRGLYNVASMCYNKAVLTIYNEIAGEFGKDLAISAFSEAHSQAEDYLLQ